MRIGSVFTGIGGFDLAFQRVGAEIAWQIEIEKSAARILEARFPAVKRFGDVTQVALSDLAPVDVLVGGFPCQDLSVAGPRTGLAGARSGLFHEMMRLAAGLQPEWVVIENVPGLLTSNQRADFATVLQALTDCGYGVAWRVLDSQFFGVPQRRRRVFIVGCLGDGRRAEQVLFEPASGVGDFTKGQQKGAKVAATLRGRSHGIGVNMPGRGGEDDQNLILGESLSHALTASSSRSGRMDPNGETFVPIAATLRACDGHHGYSSPRGDGQDNLVTAWKESQSGVRTAPDHATLDSNKGSRRQEGVITYNWQSGGDVRHQCSTEVTPTLQVQQVPAVGVRRLTPLECERLQGFPDGWTCLCPAQGRTATCTCPDSPRYRALGNAVTVNVVEWIARRLKKVG